jgi:hypothetical protein
MQMQEAEVGREVGRVRKGEDWELHEGEYKRKERCNGISLGSLISSRRFFHVDFGGVAPAQFQIMI